MKIRRADKNDIHFIENLLRENNLPYTDVASKINCFFIGEVEDEVVGICGIEIYGNCALLRSLVIIDSFRDRGYGKTLYKEIIEYAKKESVKEIYLLTTTAKDFFGRIGFEEVNRNIVPSQIQNTTEFKYLCQSTAICMRMKL